ncbi:hypothetical protein [Polyangium fumosum]|uniref:Uncharacterized protein n=1 Tax=Polyangium fumosum TaxID=889272 RepID=A0A4U1JFH1_9BACT|nr:hypothetical protein [Polyangium fumosum]TKD10006.1 hypothetical protein E8A74_10405 [Polyangium fumosum]
MNASATRAAEVAHAMSQCMNLLFMFAAPRVFASVRSASPEALASATETLRAFVRTAEGIRSRNGSLSGDVGRVIEAATLVEEICDALPGGAPIEEQLPPGVVEPARRTLAVLGFPGPREGWDEFEGFFVPTPPMPKA